MVTLPSCFIVLLLLFFLISHNFIFCPYLNPFALRKAKIILTVIKHIAESLA